MPVELKNPVIERMRAGDVSLGMIVRLARSGDVARIAKTTGHDFIFIDRQHSLYSLETVGHIAQAALGCGVVPLAESVPALNAATLVVCMIETVEGLANVEEIAAVDGVDVLHVGCNDLLAAMGKPGAFGDPIIVAAIERVIAACKAKGKYAGLGGERDLARQNAFIKKGVRFVTTQTDIGFLMMAAGQRTADIRKELAK